MGPHPSRALLGQQALKNLLPPTVGALLFAAAPNPSSATLSMKIHDDSPPSRLDDNEAIHRHEEWTCIATINLTIRTIEG